MLPQPTEVTISAAEYGLMYHALLKVAIASKGEELYQLVSKKPPGWIEAADAIIKPLYLEVLK